MNKTRIVKNILVKTPNLSGAYHILNQFFVVSYEEHDGNRELISNSFTSIFWAQNWINANQDSFHGELRIHLAKMTGEAVSDDIIASYS